MSFEEIAEELGISVSQARGAFDTGMRKLRKRAAGLGRWHELGMLLSVERMARVSELDTSARRIPKKAVAA
jgi:hypothetical protein